MITKVEALNFRCLRYIRRKLGEFHVLVGPNASGKTTFLDVIAFLRDITSEGFEAAVALRSNNPRELLFRQQGQEIQLALEMAIPEELRPTALRSRFDVARYEIALAMDTSDRMLEIKNERFLLKPAVVDPPAPPLLFPKEASAAPTTLLTPRGKKQETKWVVSKSSGGHDLFYSEARDTASERRGWVPAFKLGSLRSALGNLPADEGAFPVALWFRRQLEVGVQQFTLNSLKLRQPSPPVKIRGFLPDGSNLPWVVKRLADHPERFGDWIAHLQTALPDLEGIQAIERPEDRHCYLIFEYKGALKVPSWLVSDGTLRVAALTISAYLPDLEGIYLIEEPENGIHPRAVEAVFGSLSSVYSAQVLLASHSPIVLNCAKLRQVLCFAKSPEGSTDIVSGDEHPLLREWKGLTSLGSLLASGVLG